eukprot:TRINITY_DN18481_c0_g1_i1.p1 TRINITY_DN18481_c0_g1~~TRINITY_DN18481_c0_g1_i1.p1  ORF type:complete len:308 (+),score=142.39 TRINITY_DN18481_c0_g1_i1:157-1080(+)
MAWCTIESDPMVFNEMMEKMGVRGVEVVEVPVLEVEEIQRLGQVYGLIFLFKWKPAKREVQIVDAPHVYFAKQIVSNACATQAIINILLNRDDVEVGKELREFKEFTESFPSAERGECLGSQEVIRNVHNSFARTQCFTFEGASNNDDDDAYHFTAYIPKTGSVYELDGLQTGPILAAPDTDESKWLDAAVPLLQERVSQVQALDTKGNGLMFSLLAVARDRSEVLKTRISESTSEAEKAELQVELQNILDARETGKKENIRRRHNYIPLIVSMLKALAENGALKNESESALTRSKEKQEAAAAAKK